VAQPQVGSLVVGSRELECEAREQDGDAAEPKRLDQPRLAHPRAEPSARLGGLKLQTGRTRVGYIRREITVTPVL